MPISQLIDHSVAVPLAATAMSSLLEEINTLWLNIYDLCKTEVKSSVLKGHSLHKDFLDFMVMVCSECTTGCNSLDNIHTELLIATENQELDQASAREILRDSNKLLGVFAGFSGENLVLKGRVNDCNRSIEQQKKELSKKSLTNEVAAHLSTSTRIRTALFTAVAGVAASELFPNTLDGKAILGLSAAAFTTIGIRSAFDIFQSEKFEKLRLILDLIKAKTTLLLEYIDELGVEISGVVDDLKAYTQRTEDCIARPENLVGERVQVKGKSLIESTLALKANLQQIRVRAADNSKSIRKLIRLENASGLLAKQ